MYQLLKIKHLILVGRIYLIMQIMKFLIKKKINLISNTEILINNKEYKIQKKYKIFYKEIKLKKKI